ncbi:flavodoxin family protein [Psychromicrobium sp. YIM B11713]|uniref:flavodoxin family protein n=1 Tax=Psychromicrobium sp. YIM B11713 TaxID=3145233 RepID=UPI00374FD8CA
MSNRHFVFIEGSSRSGGNTAALARRARANLPEGASSEWINLLELPLRDFEDADDSESAPPIYPDGNEGTLLAATLRASDLVIASPLYWYSLSAPVKRYLDYWSTWLKIPGLGFRQQMAERTLWGITVGNTRNAEKASGLSTSLQLSAEYMGMHWGGFLYGTGDHPGDILRDEKALMAAERLFTPSFAAVG